MPSITPVAEGLSLMRVFNCNGARGCSLPAVLAHFLRITGSIAPPLAGSREATLSASWAYIGLVLHFRVRSSVGRFTTDIQS